MKITFKQVKAVTDNYGCLLIRKFAYGMNIPYSTKAVTMLALLQADKRSLQYKDIKSAIMELSSKWGSAADRRHNKELKAFKEHGTPFSYDYAKLYLEDTISCCDIVGAHKLEDILNLAWEAGARKVNSTTYHSYFLFGDVAYIVDWKFKRGESDPDPLKPKSVSVKVDERP